MKSQAVGMRGEVQSRCAFELESIIDVCVTHADK